MAHIVFVVICSLIDGILTMTSPNGYLINDLLLIPNPGFCAMVLTIRKFSSLDSCLSVFGYSMIYDFCFANTSLPYATIYTVIACLLQLWNKRTMETLIESLVLYIVTILIKDLLIHCYINFQRITSMSLMLWAECYELMTLLANAILVMVIVFPIRAKDDYPEMRALRIRRGEKVKWFRLKSKE